MKITKTYDWNRRDFSATLKCEGCNNIQEHTSCYDDEHYYNNVIPNIKCKKCDQSTVTLKLPPDPATLKYHPSQTI